MIFRPVKGSALGLFVFFLLNLFLLRVVSAHGGEHLVKVKDSGFEPKNIEIDQGEAIIFKNEGENPRWPASDIHPTHQIYPDFDAKRAIAPGDSWEFKFEKAGEWKFHDHLKPEFSGSIVVREVRGYKSYTSQSAIVAGFRDFFVKIYRKVKISFVKLYFNFFPKKYEQVLTSLDFFEVVDSQSELQFWLNLLGSEKVMAKLIEGSSGGSIFDCHNEAHQVGRASYELFGPETFGKGDANCHSGFYHGAMEAFLAEKGTNNLSQNIEGICSQFATSFGNFECLHGVGHGVMAYEVYEMPRALELCGELNGSFAQSSCYGGVFMENIVAGRGLGALSDHETQWVSSDPHFPCNVVDKDASIQVQCYLMQTSRMLDIFNYDFSKVSEECLRAPEQIKLTCFQSLGRDGAGNTLRDPEAILGICNLVPEEYFDACLVGALNVIVDFWGENLNNQPFELCRKVPTGESKGLCYRVLGDRLVGVFGKDEKKIREICEFTEEEYRRECLGILN